LLSTATNYLNAQLVTRLNNASFEDDPADATVPMGWFACAQGTTPDILPGFWGVYNEASDGDTYLGLITRENGTYESIGQRFKQILKKGECFSFTLDLALSDQYAGYGYPIYLRIWISDHQCEMEQLIFKSKKITSENWQKHKVEFKPKTNVEYIKIEAFYSDDKFSYQGSILIDNISPIIRCNRV
jgi:hypothetical protein